MPVPDQTIGLTNFTGSISKCPPNSNAIRSIVFSKDNLAVVNGANTEIQISLLNFFIPVSQAARISFSIPGKTNGEPYDIHKLNLGGIGLDDKVKFIAILPQYGYTASGNQMYLEWAHANSLENGNLFTEDPISPGGNISFNFSQINGLEFSWGGNLNYVGGTGSLYAATNGGLLRWNGSSMKLWNSINSNFPSDYLSSLAVDSSNNIWLGSNSGVIQFNENNENSFVNYTTSSGLVSNIVNDIKISTTNKVVVATDSGLSIFNSDGTQFQNYNVYNSPLLKHKVIKKVKISNDLIFTGTTGGVYVFNLSNNSWGNYPLNSFTITGWNAPNNIQSIDSYDGNLYVGTTGGLIVIPYTGITGATFSPGDITGTTIVTGASGPISNNFTSLRIEEYGDSYLYAGHDNGQISLFNINDNIWNYDISILGLSGGEINAILPNYLSGSTAGMTLFTGNNLNSGIYKIFTSDNSFDTVPGEGNNGNLLMTIPIGLTSGEYSIDTSKLYSTSQDFYFLFSKDMTGGATSGISFENFVEIYEGLTGGDLLSGSWSWDSTGKVATFNSTLIKAQGYNMRIAQGSTAADGSYLSDGLNVGFYTEDISPILGWNPLGKILIFSGTDFNLVQNIYLRNPQSSDVNVIALIGGH